MVAVAGDGEVIVPWSEASGADGNILTIGSLGQPITVGLATDEGVTAPSLIPTGRVATHQYDTDADTVTNQSI